MQSHFASLLQAALTALLTPVVVTRAAVAGPIEEANAAHDRGDYATALRLIRPLAEQGNANAQSNLGIVYALGQGTPRDYGEAAKYLAG